VKTGLFLEKVSHALDRLIHARRNGPPARGEKVMVMRAGRQEGKEGTVGKKKLLADLTGWPKILWDKPNRNFYGQARRKGGSDDTGLDLTGMKDGYSNLVENM